ncbi:hypothetical protein SAMN05428984_2337 [Sphingomonas sp. OK281]|nr:hypothetical protein SAMN05428984_2337 [Sphingomonas sp. OK281]
MRNSRPIPRIIISDPSELKPERQGSAAPSSTAQDISEGAHAAQGPIPESVSAAENAGAVPVAAVHADSPAEALGRRTLSTAFVMVGPDGLLTVALRNGHMLVLRNVVMRPKDYCGALVSGGSRQPKYCGGYADIVSARPGGEATPDDAGLAEANPIKAQSGPLERK